MKHLIRKILNEAIDKDKVVCDNCGWSWKMSEGGDDKYICHKCGNDNTPNKSHFDKIMDNLGLDLVKEGYGDELKGIKKYVRDYIIKNNFNLKYLNSCEAEFLGVRTKNEIIICSSTSQSTLGDFIYYLFHEIRHEIQISKIKLKNPLTDFDLNDFETLRQHYWECELDADQFAKNKIATIVSTYKIPIEIAKKVFHLSQIITNYPFSSVSVSSFLKYIIDAIKDLKKRGIPFEDVRDHPIVKKHLDKLENLI